VDLLRVVVVPERGMELDAGLPQRAVGLLELRAVVGGRVRVVDVVAQHHDEVEWEALAPGDHLLSDRVLCLIAAARVADGGETHRPVAQRQGQRARRNVDFADDRGRLAGRRRGRIAAAQADREGQQAREDEASARPCPLPDHRGSQPSATNCTDTWPRFGASVTRSNARSASMRSAIAWTSSAIAPRGRRSARGPPRRILPRA
jgi:hypothetical protein